MGIEAAHRGTWERDVAALNRELLLLVRAALRDDFVTARCLFGISDARLAERIAGLDSSEIAAVCAALGAQPLAQLDESRALAWVLECAGAPEAAEHSDESVMAHATQTTLRRSSTTSEPAR